MRNWRGFENSMGVRDHVIRHLPRDIDTFREMPNGAEYPAAHATAMAIWQRRVVVEEFVKGRSLSSRERDELKKAIVPPYPLTSFPNRWWKLKKDYPSRTLMAHIGKDTYSHIHYDSRQARVISVREAARLQSFPDGFRFCGAMNPAYRQIGNAVPPLLAQRLAEVMIAAIRAALPEPVRLRKGASDRSNRTCLQPNRRCIPAALAGVCGKVQHRSTRLLELDRCWSERGDSKIPKYAPSSPQSMTNDVVGKPTTSG